MAEALKNRTPAQTIQAIQSAALDTKAKGIRILPSSNIVVAMEDATAAQRYQSDDHWVSKAFGE